MLSKLNSNTILGKKFIETMLEENYIDYSNNYNSTTKLDNKLTKYCDNNYIGKQMDKSYYKNKIVNDDKDNTFNDFQKYDKILFLLVKTSSYIQTKKNEHKNIIYFNLGKLHELLPESYNSKINLNKILYLKSLFHKYLNY